jgi:DNA polymerase I
MADRELAKRKMIEATTIEELQHYDRVQNAIKILMNAFYGVFASAFYRFTDARIGGSITAFARENIQDIIHKLEAQNITVIYSDTDSVFFESPYHTLAETVEFGKKLAAQYSEDGVVLEFEKVIEPYFTHGKKKRYVGTVIWPTVTRIERGYETRRTDSFDLQSEALSKVFDEILSANLDGAIKYAREIVADTQKGNVPLEKLVISKTAKLERFYKEPSAQANVQAMQKLKALGYEFVPGMKVSYIVTNSRKTPQEVEPYIHGRPFRHTPDWQYYAERLALSIARVTDVFGWNEKTLLTGVEQKSLFSAEFIARGEDLESISTPSDNSDEPRAVKRVPKGKLTLEDFL